MGGLEGMAFIRLNCFRPNFKQSVVGGFLANQELNLLADRLVFNSIFKITLTIGVENCKIRFHFWGSMVLGSMGG